MVRPARFASSNAESTNEAASGVSRDHIVLSELVDGSLYRYYRLCPDGPVEPYADMFRASTLLRPDPGTEQYIVWAAAGGSVSTLENDSFVIQGNKDYVTPSSGTIEVDSGAYTDGTRTFLVQDPGNRNIGNIYSITLQRGDTGDAFTASKNDGDFDGAASDATVGKFVVTESWANTNLGGGFSGERGDKVVSVFYILSGVKFWWSKNDANKTRVKWDADLDRWAPIQGGVPTNLGPVDPEGDFYTLGPPPSQYPSGEYLPGDSADSQAFALVRAGIYPDSAADALEVRVVSNAATEADIDWGGLPGDPDAVVGATNGVLILNPDWAESNKGKTLWYNPESFDEDADGVLGSLVEFSTDSNWDHPVLSPIPEPTDRPHVRLGFRRHITPIPVDTDEDLPFDPSTVPEGSFYWSRNTGKTTFSSLDILKATPGDPLYELEWLGTVAYYDGVSLNTQPVPLQEPLPVVLEEGGAAIEMVGEGAGGAGVPTFGDLFVRRAVCMPPPGTSGVLWVPDGSGEIPDVSSVVPQTRPRGAGLVRKIEGIGDTFLFSSGYAYEVSEVVEYDEDIPALKIKIPKNKAIFSQQYLDDGTYPAAVAEASRVQIRRRPVKKEALYFHQSQVTPSIYSEEPEPAGGGTAPFRLYSRNTGKFVFPSQSLLRFRLANDDYEFDSDLLPAPLNGTDYTAQEISDHLNDTVITGAGRALAIRGRVVLEDDSATAIEVGWNTDRYDFSGHSILGFLPGWLVTTDYRWQPDNGASIGIFRSPENLDRTDSAADIRARSSIGRARSSGRNLGSISENPFFPLDYPPLIDLPGFDDGVHFRTTSGLKKVNLKNYRTTRNFGVKYEFEDNQLHWLREASTPTEQILTPANSLQLADPFIFPESVSSEAMEPNGDGFGLYLKGATSTVFSELAQDTDFLLLEGGDPGLALLIGKEGQQTYTGGQGEVSAGVFSNPVFSPVVELNERLQDAFYSAVEIGYLLEILQGQNAGVYEVTDKDGSSGVVELELNPTPEFDEGSLAWRVFEAQLPDVYDPALIADVQFVETSPYPEEPWKIKILTPIGTVGALSNANPEDALLSSRECWVRFTLDQGSEVKEASVTFLQKGFKMGAASPAVFQVPDDTDPHYTESTAGGDAYFQIRVGANTYNTTSTNLEVVNSFPPSGTNDPTKIEVGAFGSAYAGQIRIGADVLADVGGELAVWDQLFRAPTALSAGSAEMDPATGAANLSSADETAYSGANAYFVEQLVIRDNLDAQINPLGGAFLLRKSLNEGQICESSYWQADTNGDKATDDDGNLIYITEYLPNFVQLEDATRIDSRTYSFNPTGKTLKAIGSEQIWVGVDLQNYAGVVTAVVNPDSTISFVDDVSEEDGVQINYAVLESFGETETFSVSTVPVFRKPVFFEREQTQYTFEGDRTDDFLEGQVLLLGAIAFYVTGVSLIDGDTTITVFPEIPIEAGSRSPAPIPEGQLLLSNLPLSSAYPESPEGFWVEIDQAATPLQPVSRGRTSLTFFGDLTLYANNAHLLEVGGRPYPIVSGILSDDGRFTVISVGSPIQTAHDDSDVVRISARPAYPPLPVAFSTVKPAVPGEDFSLFLMGRRDSLGNLLPGRTLVLNIDFEFDPGSGTVSFKSPNQDPLQPWERLQSSVTFSQVLSPQVIDAGVVAPAYKSQYLAEGEPSKQNGYLGSTMFARYTFSSPDVFFMEVKTLVDYLVEVGGQALSNSQSGSRSSGPSGGGAPPEIGANGGLGIRGNVRDLKDQDRAARTYVEFYNGVVLAFEQVLESLNGGIIGDRDGKFKFFVGHGKTYAPVGYADEISGDLVPRLIWRAIVKNWAEDRATYISEGGFYTVDDPVFDPYTAFLKDKDVTPGKTDGKTPNPQTLQFYVEKQKRRVKNDMDDWLLVDFSRPRGLALLFPRLNIPGLFKQMWENHVLSRLYPERAQHFSRLMPGIEAVFGEHGITDPGYYTPGRKLTTPGPDPGEETEQVVRTKGDPIGKISNGVMDPITNIVSVIVSDRYPRARIWRYYPLGSSELDTALGISTVGTATIVATPLPLGDFPIDGETGFPDTDQILYNVGLGTPSSGSSFSLDTGDPDLSTPAFEEGMSLNFGKPNGTTYQLIDGSGKPILVGEVQFGCVMALTDVKGAPVVGSSVFAVDGTPLEDVVSEGTGAGDTLFVGPPTPDSDDIPEDDGEITPEVLSLMAGAKSGYDIQSDLKIARRTGSFIDNSYRTKEDVFGLNIRGFLGQLPPDPLSCVEGLVEFVNTKTKPLEIPALLGQPLNDSGDNTIPYLNTSKCEIKLLGEIADRIAVLLGADAAFTPPYTAAWPVVEQQTWLAVYPDEVITASGDLYAEPESTLLKDPATLYLPQDTRPVETATSYGPKSAIGDVRRYDLILVEVDQNAVASGVLQDGATGILTVGEVTGHQTNGDFSTLEVPRFVTPAMYGATHRYTLFSAFAYTDEGNLPSLAGLEVNQVGAGPFDVELDFSSVPGMDLDRGDNTGVGGILPLIPGNALVIRFYDTANALGTGELLGAITFVNTVVGPNCYVYPAGGSPVNVNMTSPLVLASSGTEVDKIQVSLDQDLTLLIPGLALGPNVYYEYSITIDTYIDNQTEVVTSPTLGGTGVGSSTCQILRDRLTFAEQVNLSKMVPRETVTAGSNPPQDISSSLAVWEVTLDSGSVAKVNHPDEVNGTDPFTFLERYEASPPNSEYVGTFTPFGANPEIGTVKVMSWEAFNNFPVIVSPEISASGLKVSGIPSSDFADGATDPILSGDGVILDDNPSAAGFLAAFDTVDGRLNWIQEVAVGAGDLGNPVAGDIVVTGSGTDESGYVKVGTHLVRHTVSSNAASTAGTPLYQIGYDTSAGSRVFFDLRFPKLKSWDTGTPSVTLSGVRSVGRVPSNESGFDSTGYVYIIRGTQYATYDTGTAAYEMNPNSVIRAEYNLATYVAEDEEITLRLTGVFEDAEGNAVAASDWFDLLQVNQLASGMTYIAVNPNTVDLPSNNIMGFWENSTGTACIAGFNAISLTNTLNSVHRDAPSFPAGKTWDKSVVPEDICRLLTTGSSLPALPAYNGKLGVWVESPEDSTEFYESRERAIYGRAYDSGGGPEDAIQGVPRYLDLRRLEQGEWDDAHFDTVTASAPANVLNCILPGDDLSTSGFAALSGVFLEPSIPRPALNLLAREKVVSASYGNLTANEVGIRQISDYVSTGTYEETIPFRVRRIRRFHEVQAAISESAVELRPLYEMRRGSVSTYTESSFEFTAADFNFDDFTSSAANVNAGDMVRILDTDGNVVDEAEVDVSPEAALVLTMASPGFTYPDFIGNPTAYTYEIWLEQPMIPQEQSNQQLFELLTDQQVYRKKVDWAAGDTQGGRVDEFNIMLDPTLPTNWADEGVQEGDYVVIDPTGEFDSAGNFYKASESGQRPRGDTSVDTAVYGRVPYDPGTGPSQLDDNRGFYKVVGVDVNADGDPAPGTLVLDGGSRFSSGEETPTEDQVFGSDEPQSSTPAYDTSYYALLPTIHGSQLTVDRREGQQALRPTAPAVDDGSGVLSFRARTTGQYKSIEPFSYRVIRPSPIFSEDSTELILFIRERMLSWIEEVSSLYDNPKGGDYYVFQRDDHITDIGSPTDPSSGPGIMSNYFIADFSGLTEYTPYANTSDCLSILGRRLFILDYRLDALPSDGTAPKYASLTQDDWGQRPVLPDLIAEVLDLDDRFRAQRYSWISFRADRTNGSIRRARRAEESLPEELEKQRELVEQKKALKNS